MFRIPDIRYKPTQVGLFWSAGYVVLFILLISFQGGNWLTFKMVGVLIPLSLVGGFCFSHLLRIIILLEQRNAR